MRQIKEDEPRTTSGRIKQGRAKSDDDVAINPDVESPPKRKSQWRKSFFRERKKEEERRVIRCSHYVRFLSIDRYVSDRRPSLFFLDLSGSYRSEIFSPWGFTERWFLANEKIPMVVLNFLKERVVSTSWEAHLMQSKELENHCTLGFITVCTMQSAPRVVVYGTFSTQPKDTVRYF